MSLKKLFLVCLFWYLCFLIYTYAIFNYETEGSDFGLVTKLKNLSDVHSILLGAVENDFQLVTQKESYEIASDL